MYELPETAIVVARLRANGGDLPSDPMLWAIDRVWSEAMRSNGSLSDELHLAACSLIDAIELEIAEYVDSDFESETAIAFDIVRDGFDRHQTRLNEIAAERSLEEVCEEIARMLD